MQCFFKKDGGDQIVYSKFLALFGKFFFFLDAFPFIRLVKYLSNYDYKVHLRRVIFPNRKSWLSTKRAYLAHPPRTPVMNRSNNIKHGVEAPFYDDSSWFGTL